MHSQVRIYTGFHRFTEIGHIFHIEIYIFKNENAFQVEIWPISHLNDSETQERGLKGVKIQIISWGSQPPEPAKSSRLRCSFRKSVSIYPRSTPDSGSFQYGNNLEIYVSVALSISNTTNSCQFP